MTAVHKRANSDRARIDRGFPHQVALPSDYTCMENYTTIHRFCAERFGSQPPNRQVTAWWSTTVEVPMRLFCFASRDDAEVFAAHFDGEDFNPKTDRGRGVRRQCWQRKGVFAVRERYGPLEMPKFFRENP